MSMVQLKSPLGDGNISPDVDLSRLLDQRWKKQTHILSLSTETPVAKQLDVFVTGGTGYVGSRLISTLLARGHRVRALAHQPSVGRVPDGATPVMV